jgi:hypothetical protein
MRRILVYFAIALATLQFNCVKAGETQGALDTIIKVEGKIMPVDVIIVTSTYIRFTVPGNEEVFTIPRKEVHKIIYKNGRIEEFNSMAVTMIDESSWQAVWLTEDPQEVLNLYKRGEANAQSPPSARSPQAAKKSAIIRLQKQAASMKGIVVLVTKKQATGGYGEFPGYYIEGIVYGNEPLTEEEVGKKDIL